MNPPFTTNQLLMIRPARFGFNEQTGSTNTFQHKLQPETPQLYEEKSTEGTAHDYSTAPDSAEKIAHQALCEFENSVSRLRAAGVEIRVWNDNPHPPKPDAVFLNNWFSTHPGGEFLLYPMMAENRRTEIVPAHIAELEKMGLKCGLDLSAQTSAGMFLEGTGSLVFDHRYRVVFATESPRTHQKVAERVALHLGYRLYFLTAIDEQAVPPYHTNVVLSVGPTLAVACLDAIVNPESNAMLRQQLGRDDRCLIEISFAQMGMYCANVLEVQNKDGEKLLIASRTAWDAFSDIQRAQISRIMSPLILDIPIIERIGGGSARCMIAELFGVDAAFVNTAI